jgi:hypothetical protein
MLRIPYITSKIYLIKNYEFKKIDLKDLVETQKQ